MKNPIDIPPIVITLSDNDIINLLKGVEYTIMLKETETHIKLRNKSDFVSLTREQIQSLEYDAQISVLSFVNKLGGTF